MESQGKQGGGATGWKTLRRFVAVLTMGLMPAAASAELAVGDPSPEFTLQGSDGSEYSLESLLALGKPGIVLAWFPKAFTSG